MELLQNLLSPTQFIPHGHCYLWKPELVWLHVVSDAMIAIAYFSIPASLIYFVRKRQDVPFTGIFWLFGAFIVSCGLTHLMGIWTLWHPTYWLSGTIKAITAIVSLYTALELLPLIPQALTLPSPAQLEIANQKLAAEIYERQQAELEIRRLNQELEERVTTRTADLQQANQQKEELLQRYTTLARLAPVGIFRTDETGHCVYTNEYWREIAGMSDDEAQGSGWIKAIHPDDLDRVTEVWQETVQANEMFRLEYRFQRSDGVITWVLGQALAEIDYQGERVGYVGTVTDLTDRKRAEIQLKERAQELKQVNRTLAQASALLKQRNQELDQFAYVVSHDLKAPLRAISNLSEWIEEDLQGQLPPENQEQMQLLRSRVYRMEALINGLLDYSRVGRVPSKTETVNVSALLTEVIDSIDPPDTWTIDLAADLPTFTANVIPLQQVFSNLISNAFKHHDRPDGKIEISAHDRGDYYEFTVRDDGPGIDPKYHQQIFEIFKTLKSRDTTGNTGIGLSIVKKLIETEGGTIHLASQIGQGAAFHFTWPKQPVEG